MNSRRHENPEPSPKWDVQDAAKLQYQFDDYLHYMNGELNLPLAYVMHEQVDPMLEDEDDLPTNYATAREEMIAHVLHKIDKTNAEFQINSGKAFDALALIMREMAAWTYVKPFAKKCDGGSAITALSNHYLGLNNVNNQASAAEHVLNLTTYTGETALEL
jgi:hypothetical protein